MTPSSRFLRKNIATSDEMNTINGESLKIDGPSTFCFCQAPKTRGENALESRTFFQRVTEIAKKHNKIMIFETKSDENARFRCTKLWIFIQMLKICPVSKRIFSTSFGSLTKTKYTRTIYSSSSIHFRYLFHHSLRYFFSKIAKKMSIMILL